MMETTPNNVPLARTEISFSNGQRATGVSPPNGAGAADIIKALEIPPPQAVLLLSGGADEISESLKPRLASLFGRCLAPAAADTGALIIDGGTQSGVMEMMGRGVAESGHKTVLVGVAPRGKVAVEEAPKDRSKDKATPLDPNHSHFVLPEGNEWGDETDTMLALAGAFEAPFLNILVNGGPTAAGEVLRSVRQGRPVVLVEGSGRLADELAKLWKTRPAVIESPAHAEIISRGDIRLFPISGSAEDMERLILAQSCHRPLLESAWRLFATYDLNAGLLQKYSRFLQNGILWLGVIAVALAVAQAQAETLLARNTATPYEFLLRHTGWLALLERTASWLKPLLVALPIITTILLAAANRFRQGNKWILLRSSAEALKREIYSYRARAGQYGARQLGDLAPQDKLQRQIETITRRLMQTEVNRSALKEYAGLLPPKMFGAAGQDDGFDFLSIERYIEIRVGDELIYYQVKSRELDRRLKFFQVLILAAGGVGTLLAAFGHQVWIALTTALATALTTFLAQRQVEQNLIQYNQTATDLANIQGWWTKLTPAEKRSRDNIDRLVEFTEKVLEGQMSGWVQRMEDILTELREQQAKKTRKGKPDTGDEKADG